MIHITFTIIAKKKTIVNKTATYEGEHIKDLFINYNINSNYLIKNRAINQGFNRPVLLSFYHINQNKNPALHRLKLNNIRFDFTNQIKISLSQHHNRLHYHSYRHALHIHSHYTQNQLPKSFVLSCFLFQYQDPIHLLRTTQLFLKLFV